MRTFIAVEFSESFKQYLHGKQQEIKKYSVKGNFTLIGNFHLTLRFLGEIEPPKIKYLKEVIDETVSACKPFELTLDNIGQFPRGNKKILWVGLRKSSELQELYKILEAALGKAGYEKEDRSYNPHITLGREVLLENFDDVKKYVQVESEKTIEVNGISLMESTRVNGILTYRPIYHGDFM